MFTMVKVFQDVNKALTQILDEIQKPTFSSVRKFVVDYTQLDASELVLFGAFQAPKDDLFYLSEDSETWKIFKRALIEVKISDEEKYRWKLRFVLNSITASGAAIFRGLEENNIIS